MIPVKDHSFDSAFARQLDAGFRWLRFSRDLEPGFREAHFERNRVVVRGALIIGLLLALAPVAMDILAGRPPELLSYAIRLGVLAPVFILSLVVSFLPRQKRLFRGLLAATGLAVALSYVAINLGVSPDVRQMDFSSLPVVIAFVYFALGLFLRTAVFAALSMAIFYAVGATLTGMSTDLLTHNLVVLLIAGYLVGASVVGRESHMRCRQLYLAARAQIRISGETAARRVGRTRWPDRSLQSSCVRPLSRKRLGHRAPSAGALVPDARGYRFLQGLQRPAWSPGRG